MSHKVVKLPDPAHPITTEANLARVIVRAGGRVVADFVRTLTLQEASYPAVHYIPSADIDMAALTRSTHGSYCPYKGEAAYFNVEAEGGRIADAARSYEHPFAVMAGIKDHLAFYPDRVDGVTETPRRWVTSVEPFGRIALSHGDVDYRNRLEPAETLAGLRSLRDAPPAFDGEYPTTCPPFQEANAMPRTYRASPNLKTASRR